MMGDREKCIQAQMDEYLSKPLQQNHLIQTILKCATLGGQLLEKNRGRELARAADAATGGRRDNGALSAAYQAAAGQVAVARPPLSTRAITTAEGPLDSPSIVTADAEDPMNRARSSLSAPNIHSA